MRYIHPQRFLRIRRLHGHVGAVFDRGLYTRTPATFEWRGASADVRPNQALTAPPITAVFEGIDVNTLPTGYTIFVFVFPKGSTDAPPLGPSVATMTPQRQTEDA